MSVKKEKEKEEEEEEEEENVARDDCEVKSKGHIR